MIRLMSQMEAERSNLPASNVQSISPFLNPAHVLSPPRHWLDALVSGKYSWPFFRLRYKSLLRKRFHDSPERFFSLLDGSEGKQALTLTCHCLEGNCHRGLAREFLESLRNLRVISAKRHQPMRVPLLPTRKWANGTEKGTGKGTDKGLALSTLIEHPSQARAAS